MSDLDLVLFFASMGVGFAMVQVAAAIGRSR